MTTLQIFAIAAGLVFGALFSGLETGVISIHRLRLRHSLKSGSRASRILMSFLENSDRLLGTTLVGTNVSIVMVSVTATSMARRFFGDWGEPVATAVVSMCVLVLCEYLPKSWFHSKPLERCTPFASFLKGAESVLRPISTTVLAVTRLVLPGPSTAFSKSDPFVTRDELKALAREGARNGVLSPKESVMIRRVFNLSALRADRVMVPLHDIVRAGADMNVPERTALARTPAPPRFHVPDADRDTFIGVVNVYSVLSDPRPPDDRPMRDYVRPPLIVPVFTPVDEILPRLRHWRQPMCLVRGQNEKIVGLITTEDILKQIVGSL